ncbi:MAG: hypothetical protein HETSPECPRED_004023 [Heterodermia speciosa]|uniref:Cytochrome P450 n=1 Tax=Heterodermia speciosa TaxID=116794 RepID=A0A8H3F7F3_9LECA|nr:MAG: hypothetical protein HETSPECPRED_004023 [Heterodermia speciosa]
MKIDSASATGHPEGRVPAGAAISSAFRHGLNLRQVLLALVIATFTYRFIKRAIQNRVRPRRSHAAADEAFAAKNGCKPVRSVFPYKWPFALDLLYRQYQVNKTQRLLAFQTQFFDRLGSTIEFRLFGDIGFFTFNPKNIEAILSTNFEDYGLGSRSDALRAFLGEGIFTQDGAQWKHSREMLRRPFVKMHYQDLTGFGEHINDLITHLKSCSGIVDLQPFFFRFTLATTTALIFGQPIKDYASETQHAFARSFDHASLISATRIRLADFFWAYTPSKYTESCKTVKEYATGFVEQAMQSTDEDTSKPETKYAFIRDLYNEYKDPILVRDQLVNVLIAGRDTTAALLSWTFFLLVRHPPVLIRLRQEILAVVEEGTLNRGHIQKLRWLKCVLNESMVSVTIINLRG